MASDLTPASQPRHADVAAVIVTRNRVRAVASCLAAVEAQTVRPGSIVVVDNASTDGTAAWLSARKGLKVLSPGRNLGGAGGFAAGIKAAWGLKHEFIWCMDDDAAPDNSALERLVESPAASRDDTGFLCSVVLWTDGSVHRMNAPGLAPESELAGCDPIPGTRRVVTASFVSLLLPARVVARVGLPIPDLFLWYDDTEYTYRITRRFRGYEVAASVVRHETDANHGPSWQTIPERDLWKMEYGIRNRLYWVRHLDAPAPRRLRIVASHALRAIREIAVFCPPRRKAAMLLAVARGLVMRPRIPRLDDDLDAQCKPN
jgi:GT2 family glycosyltransferase